MLRLRTLFHAVKANHKAVSCTQIDILRHGSYDHTPQVGDPSLYTDYEVSKSPEEYKYVEWLLKRPNIPIPTPKDSYPSGWTPQTADPSKLPYFIHRTKSHMIPCYLKIKGRGERKLTQLRWIEGDIWQLKDDIEKWLYKANPNLRPGRIGISVREFQRLILIHGDWVNAVKKFLIDRGF